MTIIKIKKMLETLLQYENSEIIHTIYSVHNTFSLSYSKELKNFQVKMLKQVILNIFRMLILRL